MNAALLALNAVAEANEHPGLRYCRKNNLFLKLVNRGLWKMFMNRTIERGPQLSNLN
jgi:hypothetical protein